MKKFFKKIFNRNFLIILLLAVQALFMLACFFKLYEYTNLIYGAQTILSLLMVCFVINKKETNPAYKLSWTILIMLIPIVGALIYILLHAELGTLFFKGKKNQIIKMTKPLIPQDKNILYDLERESIYMAHLAKYVNDYGGYPIYKNTTVEYYSVGEEKYASMLYELEKAERLFLWNISLLIMAKCGIPYLIFLKEKQNRASK